MKVRFAVEFEVGRDRPDADEVREHTGALVERAEPRPVGFGDPFPFEERGGARA